MVVAPPADESSVSVASEPISPELVLVCPELRAALAAAWRAELLDPRPGEQPSPVHSQHAEEQAARVLTGWRRLALASALYATSRVAVMLLQVALVLTLITLLILAATGF
jgi:hypothetical protein